MATVTTTPTRSRGAARPTYGRASPLRVARVIWQRDVLVYVRDRARLVSSMAMPLIMLVIFGEGFGRTIGSFEEGINYRQFIFPGVVAMTVMMNSVFSGVSIIWDREFGFLRELLVAPISRTAIGIGKLLGGATWPVVQASVLFVLAPILGVNLSPLVMLQLIAVLFVLALAMTSVGIAIASKVRSVESFQMVSQLTIMPSMFLSGIFFPVNNVPVWIEVLAKVNPVTYAVAPIRRIALGDQLTEPAGEDSVVNVELFGHVLSSLESLAIVLAFAALMLAVAIRSFRARE